MSRLYQNTGTWSWAAVWLTLLLTVAFWIASVAYTQTRPVPVERPVDEPVVMEKAETREFDPIPLPAEKSKEIKESKQIASPKDAEDPEEVEELDDPPSPPDRLHIV